MAKPAEREAEGSPWSREPGEAGEVGPDASAGGGPFFREVVGGQEERWDAEQSCELEGQGRGLPALPS